MDLIGKLYKDKCGTCLFYEDELEQGYWCGEGYCNLKHCGITAEKTCDKFNTNRGQI